jgi:hypothetical protein
MPARKDMPDPVRRSSAKAQRTWGKAHDAAVKQYGEGARAHRTAFAALKHSFEKVGDRWQAKSTKGPSDPQARKSGRRARHSDGQTFGGVDYYGNSKEELYKRAAKMGVEGRSRMSKKELAEAIAKKQR